MLGKRKRDSPSLDRITEDGILCLIISFLLPKEAVRTCILSRRWRHIWTHLPKINFDASNMLGGNAGFFTRTFDFRGNVAATMTDKFVTLVDLVVKGQQGARVEEFTIRFSLNKTHSDYLDTWLHYGVTPKTKKLVIDLSPPLLSYLLPMSSTNLYDFPYQLLELSSIEIFALRSCSLKLPHGFIGLRYLKRLLLDRVGIIEEDIRCLLSNCLTLEFLDVSNCPQLGTLSISQPLSRLKHLALISCNHLRKIEFDAINLTTLNYMGSPADFLFKKSSHLTTAYIGFEGATTDFDLSKLSYKLPHLEYLQIWTRGASQINVSALTNSNRFAHLRKLEWAAPYSLQNKMGCIYLASILSVAPFLEKLYLSYNVGFEGYLRELKQIKHIRSSPHTHLKTIEFTGFTGDKWQIRFALYILSSAVKLELLTLHKAGGRWDKGCYKNYFEANMEHFRREVPTNVNLVVV